MSHLSVVSGKDICKILSKVGYVEDHQTGSHFILIKKQYPFRRLSIPNHKEIAKGTLRAIIRQSGLSLEEYNKLSNQNSL